MKKRILPTLAIFSLIFATNLLTACDDDDDDSGSSVYNNEATVMTTADGDKLLVTYCDQFTYTYDDEGNLTCVSNGFYGSLKVDSDPFTLEGSLTSISLTVNGNGFITKCVFAYEYEDEECDETSNFSYDGSGHLTKLSYSGTEYGDAISGNITLTWSNGKLTKMVQSETCKEEDGDSYKETATYTFSYDDEIENTTKQYVPTFFDYCGEEPLFGGIFNCSAFAYIGLLGVGSTYLPESVYIEFSDDAADEDDTEVDFTYSFNNNGSVSYWKSTDYGRNSGYIYYDDYPEDTDE